MNIGKRIEITSNHDGINAAIKTQKNVFLLIFLPIWLTGWTFGGIAAATSIITGKSSPVLIFWLCGWVIGEVFTLFAWLWNAFGREVITVDKGFFIYNRELFGMAFTKKTLSIRNLSELRASGFFATIGSYSYAMAQWVLQAGPSPLTKD